MATSIAATLPRELEQEALSWPERARGIRISDQSSYNSAARLLLDIAALTRRIQEHHKPIKDAAYAAHKAAVAAEKRLLDPLAEATAILKKAISIWEADQERLRLETERKAREAAAKIEEEFRLEQAVAAQEAGADEATVDQILATPIRIPVPVAAPTFERAKGVGTQQRWKAEVIDLRALCREIAEGRLPEEYVIPNMTALNARARAEKQAMSIPGVRAVPETVVAVRR